MHSRLKIEHILIPEYTIYTTNNLIRTYPSPLLQEKEKKKEKNRNKYNFSQIKHHSSPFDRTNFPFDRRKCFASPLFLLRDTKARRWSKSGDDKNTG